MTEKKKKAVKKSPQKIKRPIKSSTTKPKKPTSEIDEIIARLTAEVDREELRVNPPRKLRERRSISFPGSLASSFSQFKFGQPSTRRILTIAVITALVISGFWARPIVKFLGFPVDPAPFTAIYFDDPHIGGTGIKNGSQLAFGINNGSVQRRTFHWTAKLSGRNFAKGAVTLEPNTERLLKVAIRNAKPGDFIEIAVDKLKTPIAAVVTG